MAEALEGGIVENYKFIEPTMESLHLEGSAVFKPESMPASLSRMFGADAVKDLKFTKGDGGKIKYENTKTQIKGEMSAEDFKDPKKLSTKMTEVLGKDSAGFKSASEFANGKSKGGRTIKENLTKSQIDLAAEKGIKDVFTQKDIKTQGEFEKMLRGEKADPTTFDKMLTGTVKLLTDPKMITLGVKVVLGVLTFDSLQKMAQSSNGCYMFDMLTGEQLAKLDVGNEECNCMYKGDGITDNATKLSGGAVRSYCANYCNLDGMVANYDSVECQNNPSSSNCGCFGSASPLCNCRMVDPNDETKTVLARQNFKVQEVKDDAFSMLAKILASAGAQISGFTGALTDGALSLVEAATGAASSITTIIIVVSCVAGAILLCLGAYYIYKDARNKRLRNAAAQNAAAQQGRGIQVISMSPQAASPPPVVQQLSGGGRGISGSSGARLSGWRGGSVRGGALEASSMSGMSWF